MATQTMSDTRPTFSRLTEGRSSKAWKAAVPAVVVLVAFVALLFYLASSMSSAEQRAMNAERDNQQMREQQAGITKQVGALQQQLDIARSSGRTTVILQAADKTDKKAAKADGTATWAAATWGEGSDGKTWLHVNAYGLSKQEGKAYDIWFIPKEGDPVVAGGIEMDENGNGFLLTQATLPGVDQGKQLQLTLDENNAKQPGQVIAQADLPKLEPTAKAPPAQPAGEAKTGETSQPMHQGK